MTRELRIRRAAGSWPLLVVLEEFREETLNVYPPVNLQSFCNDKWKMQARHNQLLQLCGQKASSERAESVCSGAGQPELVFCVFGGVFVERAAGGVG